MECFGESAQGGFHVTIHVGGAFEARECFQQDHEGICVRVGFELGTLSKLGDLYRLVC